jgi:hypothetical protein
MPWDKEKRREYMKEYREKNREKLLQKMKEYRENNQEKLSQKMKEYRENNQEKISQKMKEYREKNRVEISQKKKEYHKKNRVEISQYYKEYLKKHLSCKVCHLFITHRENKICSSCDPEARQKTKELQLKEFLEYHYDITYNKNIQVSKNCERYYPDFIIDRYTFFIVIECDENAHKSYNQFCEVKRMENIQYQLGLPCIFIRYNPDKKINIDKHRILKSYIDYYFNKDFINPEIVYLFY